MVIYIGIFGAMIGSFLNVVAYRLPLKQSIISPPSACTRCNIPIRRYDSIPVISWLILRGRCRNCQGSISKRYPIVELTTGLSFSVVAWKFLHLSGSAVFLLIAFLYLAAMSVVLTLIDLETHTLPNSLVLPGYLVGAIFLSAAGIASSNYGAMLRGAIGAAALWLLYFLMAVAYPEGMGFGDVKFAGLLGLFLGYLGWDALITGGFAAFFFGGLFALSLLLLKRKDFKSGIPFGPWMVVGAWVGVFFGTSVVQGYLSIFSPSLGI